MEDNGFVAVGGKLEIGDRIFCQIIGKHGPVMVAGTYGITRLGHAVVVVGVDHASKSVCVQDPAQSNASVRWFPLDYVKYTVRTPGSIDIDMYSVITIDSTR